MAFWNSQTLAARLSTLVDPSHPGAIDCNAITLHMGHEVYVTPSVDSLTPGSHTKALLGDNEPFAIPAGQFAFLLTEESVTVPRNAMAFISMKARIKFRGLINVSGFHVDPGYTGRLIFSVFNAGPSSVHLQQGMPLFLIWYTDLNDPSDQYKKDPGAKLISPDLINNISGELNSFQSLRNKIDKESKALGDRIHALETSQKVIQALAGILMAILVGVIVYELTEAPNKVAAGGANVAQTNAAAPLQHMAAPANTTKASK